jgi:arabinofuranosyltransferase
MTRRDLVLALLLGGVMWLGWRLTHFATDDAYIAFRFVSNAMAGRGLVWNPAPFHPVEGYTSFSWVMLLWAMWAWLGLEPPLAADMLGLLFGVATLALVWRALRRQALPRTLEPHRSLITAITLLALASHRVFLTWLSSGLETALFVFSMTLWVLVAVAPGEPERAVRRATCLSLAAALVALTRPDGLLAVAFTFLVVALDRGRRRFLGLWPLLLVVGHVVWRRWFYGEWLPNTYYAKFVAPWPEAGWRYLASFVFENGTWAWLLLAAGCGLAALLRGGGERWHGAPPSALRQRLRAWVAVAVVSAHGYYYTARIGGDHFEYRVFAHLPPLLALGSVWLACRTFRRPLAALLVLAFVAAAPLPIAWFHWRFDGPLQPHVPAAIRPLFAPFDAWQKWLHTHMIGMRRSALQHALTSFAQHYGSRDEGGKIPFDERPVTVGATIGVLGWVLPHVAVIDSLGLTDWVVARNPVAPPAGVGQALLQAFDAGDSDKNGVLDDAEQRAMAHGAAAKYGLAPDAVLHMLRTNLAVDGDGVISRRDIGWMLPSLDNRQMAHERSPPPGYLEGFRPNVQRIDGKFLVTPRALPLTDAEIVAHEAKYRALMRR